MMMCDRGVDRGFAQRGSVLRALISAGKVDVDARAEPGALTPLAHLASYGDLEGVRLLLQHGAQPALRVRIPREDQVRNAALWAEGNSINAA